jgi:exopolysaccharide biosynthesis polyprenyl glycosylphosphotransferase
VEELASARTTDIDPTSADSPAMLVDSTADHDNLAVKASVVSADDSPDISIADPILAPTDDTAVRPLGVAPVPVQPLVAKRGTLSAWTSRYSRSLMISDGVVGMLAVFVTTFATPFSAPKTAVLMLCAAIAWPLAVAVSRGYERTNIGIGSDEMRAVLRAVVYGIAAGAVPSAMTGRYGVVALCVLGMPIAGAASLLVRFFARKNLHRQQREGRNVRRVIVAGSAYAAADLANMLTRDTHVGTVVIGVCVPRDDMERAREAGLKVVGDLEEVPEQIRLHGADAVAVAGGDATRHNFLRELSWALEGAGVELLVHPGLIEVAGPRMHIRPYVGLPLLYVEQPNFTGWRRLVKRGMDLILTTLGVLVISPLLGLVALAIKLNDRGPVIFRQTRVGLDGSTFTMFKFRTMHVDAEARVAELRAQHPGMGTMFKLTDDPRITRVGRFLRRFSIDELPQLMNVLAGHMSLVGPRPPLQSEVDVYEDHARRRLLVTPGLTGLWQISGRSLLSWEETVRLDLRYVENWSLTLDLLIIWKTSFAILTRRGAY